MVYSPQLTSGTCNGNGDGFINSDGSGENAPFPMYETWRAWQQLAYAGFVEGTFTGTPYVDCYTNGMPGVNEPAAKLAGGAFEWNYVLPAYVYNALNGGVIYTGMKFYTQYMFIGASTSYGCGPDVLPIMTPAEALALDGKVDDGMPTTGKWIAGDYLGECETPQSTVGPLTIRGVWRHTLRPLTIPTSRHVPSLWKLTGESLNYRQVMGLLTSARCGSINRS